MHFIILQHHIIQFNTAISTLPRRFAYCTNTSPEQLRPSTRPITGGWSPADLWWPPALQDRPAHTDASCASLHKQANQRISIYFKKAIIKSYIRKALSRPPLFIFYLYILIYLIQKLNEIFFNHLSKTKGQQMQLFFSKSSSSSVYLNFGFPFALEKGKRKKQLQTNIICRKKDVKSVK